jgi:hypothetical protein
MALGIFSPLDYSSGGIPSELLVAANFEKAMGTVSVKFPQFSAQVKRSLVEMIPVFVQVARQLSVNTNFNTRGLRANLKSRQPLYTKFVTPLSSFILLRTYTYKQLHGCYLAIPQQPPGSQCCRCRHWPTGIR